MPGHPMKDLTKFRKISDDLYVEDYVSEDGANSPVTKS